MHYYINVSFLLPYYVRDKMTTYPKLVKPFAEPGRNKIRFFFGEALIHRRKLACQQSVSWVQPEVYDSHTIC